jgi:hypothetical protein
MRPPTHPEAVYLARALNLNIETVWEIIRPLRFSSYTDLELAVHNRAGRPSRPGGDDGKIRSSVASALHAPSRR